MRRRAHPSHVARDRGATLPVHHQAPIVSRLIKNPRNIHGRFEQNVPAASRDRITTLRNLRPAVLCARTTTRLCVAFKRGNSGRQPSNTKHARHASRRSSSDSRVAANAAAPSSRRMRLIARAVRPLPQVRDKHGNSDHAHRDGGDATGGPAQPHSQHHRRKQDREQRRESDHIVRNAIGLAIEILGRPEAGIIANGRVGLNGHACRRAGYVPCARWAFCLARFASSSRIDDQILAIVLKMRVKWVCLRRRARPNARRVGPAREVSCASSGARSQASGMRRDGFHSCIPMQASLTIDRPPDESRRRDRLLLATTADE
jgi:hypothetical protein